MQRGDFLNSQRENPHEVFDRINTGLFQTLKSKDQVEGSGLGLAMVKRNLENLGGTIRLDESNLGRGLSATIELPEPSNEMR